MDGFDELWGRLRRGEDELAIRRVVLSYEPAADAGSSPLAAFVWLELPDGFEVRLGPPKSLDRIEQPKATAKAPGRLAQAGVTIAEAHLAHHSLEDCFDQLEALGAVNEAL